VSEAASSRGLAFKPYLGLAIGVTAASFSSVFIRLAEAPPLIIGAYRLGIASLLLTPFALWTAGAELRRLARRDVALSLASGVFLGLHFAFWITSLDYTTVASSVVLVATNPLFVGLASHFLLRDKLNRLIWLGVLLSIAGAVIIGLGDFTVTGRGLLGDFLALLGAVAGSSYFLLGRQLRRRLSLLAYVLPTYWTAAVVLTLAAWLAGNRFAGYSGQTFLMFLLLALFPQIAGHSSLNWALKHLSPTLVTVSLLAEPILATIQAYFILSEVPTLIKIGGGALVLAGIYIAMQGERRRETDGG